MNRLISLLPRHRAMALLAGLMAGLQHAAPVSAQATAYPLAGQWTCTSTPIALPARPPLPAMTLSQRYAYAANAQGLWSSNSVMDFAATNGQHYRLRASSQGHSTYINNTVQQTLHRFEVLSAQRIGSKLAQAHGQRIDALVRQAAQQQAYSRYQVLDLQPDRFALRPMHNGGQQHTLTLTCNKTPSRTPA